LLVKKTLLTVICLDARFNESECFCTLKERPLRVGIIVNPHSRHNVRCPDLAAKYQKIGGEEFEVMVTDSARDLFYIAQEFRKRKIPYLGISGGDGTVHNVISAFIREYSPDPIPDVILLDDGTMNNIAGSIGMSSEWKYILSRFLSDLNNGSLIFQKRDTIEIDGKYCFLFGCGIVTNFLVEAYHGEKGFGRNLEVVWLSIVESIKTMFCKDATAFRIMKSLSADLYVSGKKLPLTRILALLAGTVEKIGMGMKPLSMAGKTTGYFHMIATEMSCAKILFNLIPIGSGLGLPFHDSSYFDVIVNDIEIRAHEPFEYTMDGDMYLSDGILKAKPGPAIRFVVV
jgi:diacylglycerol kinase family enzyme